MALNLYALAGSENLGNIKLILLDVVQTRIDIQTDGHYVFGHVHRFEESPGVTREMGSDAIATADWFASRKKINHVHFRNIQVIKP